MKEREGEQEAGGGEKVEREMERRGSKREREVGREMEGGRERREGGRARERDERGRRE